MCRSSWKTFHRAVCVLFLSRGYLRGGGDLVRRKSIAPHNENTPPTPSPPTLSNKIMCFPLESSWWRDEIYPNAATLCGVNKVLAGAGRQSWATGWEESGQKKLTYMCTTLLFSQGRRICRRTCSLLSRRRRRRGRNGTPLTSGPDPKKKNAQEEKSPTENKHTQLTTRPAQDMRRPEEAQ